MRSRIRSSSPRFGPADADLARIIAAWPTLPADVKAGIVVMVQTAKGKLEAGAAL